jgi:hypothetical protein
MALYSVYLPSSGQMTTQEIMGRAIFIKDRFSWGAFLIPPLWLGYKRIWRWLLVYALLEGLLIAGATNIALNPALTGIISLLIAFFIGICGREWWGAALERRGFELAGIVQGETPEDAERRFYDHYRSARPRNLVVQPFSASSSQSTREPGVIGLFPDIRGFR